MAELVDDEDPNVANEAAYALAKIGPGAKAAVPALEELQLHRVDFIRAAAREALSKIQSEG